MSFQKKIFIKNGKRPPKPYYYWEEFDIEGEAYKMAKQIKQDRKLIGQKVKYVVVKDRDSWFLPVTKWVLYLDKKLRLI